MKRKNREFESCLHTVTFKSCFLWVRGTLLLDEMQRVFSSCAHESGILVAFAFLLRIIVMSIYSTSSRNLAISLAKYKIYVIINQG